MLFVDDIALMVESENGLQKMVTEFGSVCERRKLRVHVGKSKIMKCLKVQDGGRLNVRLNGELLEEGESFKYVIDFDCGSERKSGCGVM